MNVAQQKKRYDRRNAESVRISKAGSSYPVYINNTIITITDVRAIIFLGKRRRARSEDPRSPPVCGTSPLRKPLQRLLWSMV